LIVTGPLQLSLSTGAVNTNPCPHSFTLSVPGPLTNTGAFVSMTTNVWDLVVRFWQVSAPPHVIVFVCRQLLPLVTRFELIVTGPLQLSLRSEERRVGKDRHSITLSVPGPLTNTGALVSTTTIVCELVVRLLQVSAPTHVIVFVCRQLLPLVTSFELIVTGPLQLSL